MFKTLLAYENWKSKYAYMNETPIETFMRVAKALASVEKYPELWYDKFLKTLVKFDLLNNEPIGLKCTTGGRITANAGTDYNGATLINCFINGPVTNAKIIYNRKNEATGIGYKVEIDTEETPDNLHNIFLTVLEQAKTLASEGGYGINFSFIRPRGTLIKSIGIKHPGVVSYMEIWDSVSECIVKGDTDGYKDKIKNYLEDEKDIKEFEDVTKKMVRKGAMMGVLNCLSGETLISTIEGKVKIKDIVDKNPLIYCTDGKGKVFIRQAAKVWKTGTRKTKKILLDNDDYLICTPEHLIMLSDGTYKKAEELTFGDSLAAFNKVVYVRKGPYKTSGYYQIGVTGRKGTIPEHIAVSEFMYGRYPEVKLGEDGCSYCEDSEVVHHKDGNSINNNPNNIELMCHKDHSNLHKKDYINYFNDNRSRIAKERKGKTWEEYYGVEKALILKEKARKRIKSNRKGSWNKGISNDEYKKHYKNGFKNQFNEDVTTWDAAYGEEVATLAKLKKTETLRKNIESLKIPNHKVISVIDWIEEDVYDISVPEFHNFVANGIFVHNCSHPDIEEFVKAKQESGKLTKFNISVAVDDLFMQAVENNDFYDLHFNGLLYKRVKARELYNLIMESTYNRAEPGVLFIDNMHKNNPVSYLGRATCANPCGEIPGIADLTTVCLLGSVNLTQYVDDNRHFNFDQYAEDVKTFTRMLDNVNDLATTPLPSYTWAVKNLRQIGMGINGLGSALVMLGIPYNSESALNFVKKICEMKENITLQTSALLAKEKGVFTAYNKELFESTEYFNSNRITEETKELIRKYGVRNAKTTTNPPLGNSSVICDNVSNGIEPVFSLEYERIGIVSEWPEGLNKDNVMTVLKHFKKKDYAYWRGEYNGATYYYEPHNRGLCEVKVIRDYGYAWVLEKFPNMDHSEYLQTTQKLKAEEHLVIQEVVQYYCNQSVSKTINLPKSYSFTNFKTLYMEAWKKGINGLTTYREGSMESVISSLEHASTTREIVKGDIKLPTTFINGTTTIVKREGMKFYIHFSYLPEDVEMKYPVCLWIYTNSKINGQMRYINKAVESLTNLALKSGINSKLVEVAVEKAKNDDAHSKLGRMVSLCLRHNVSRDKIYVSLSGIEGDNISTMLTAVRHYISSTIEDGTVLNGIKCDSCGSENVRMVSGCKQCSDCGYSACG